LYASIVTWGLNDGLGWCPHDSAFVNVTSSDVTRRVAAKTVLLDVNPDRKWKFRPTPTEWVWRSSINEGQLRTLAEGSRRLADLRNEPTVTMWLVNLLDYGDTDSLAWFCTSYELGLGAGYQELDVKPRRVSERYNISEYSDLEEVSRSDVEPGAVLCLRPRGGLVRDSSFIERVGDVALAKGLVVEIEGSPLAHPYYALRRREVPVNCVTARKPKASSSMHEKLVRDNVPAAIRSRGENVVAYSAGSGERESLLRAKLVEEALEVLGAIDSDEVLEELADLMEVVDGLRRALGIEEAEIEAAMERKRRRRGGFDESVVLIKTSPFEFDLEGVESGRQQVELPDMGEYKRRIQRWQLRRLENGGLLISYVPPVGDEVREFDTSVNGIRIRVRYRDKGIEIISLERSDTEGKQERLPGL